MNFITLALCFQFLLSIWPKTNVNIYSSFVTMVNNNCAHYLAHLSDINKCKYYIIQYNYYLIVITLKMH